MFFELLSDNLAQFLNDKTAAYDYIKQLLHNYLQYYQVVKPDLMSGSESQ